MSYKSKIEAVHKLTDAENKSIEVGIKDATKGRIHTSEEARAMVKQLQKVYPKGI